MNHRLPRTNKATATNRYASWLRLSSLTLALGLTACANMSGIQTHASIKNSQQVGMPATQAANQTINAQWWTALGDVQLNHFIDQALADSPSLKLAQARLLKAQAQSGVANADRGPQVTGQVDATRQLFTQNGMVPAPLGGTVQNTGTVQLNLSWELDFFGRQRAALDATIGAVRASEADAQAAQILLATEITRQYINLARLQSQADIAQRALAQRTETLALVRDRVHAGLDTQLELRQSEGSLPQSRQQIEALNEQIALSKNALAALVGNMQLAATITAPRITALNPLTIPENLPADLLGQRADITAARWRVEAAQSDISYAKTLFYPNVNLVSFIGLNSLGLNRVFEGDSKQWAVGPAIRLPIFESGKLRANLQGKTADYDAAVEQYNSRLIDAVHQVADQVVSSRSIVQQQHEQSLAQTASENAYDIARSRYQAGLSSYLQVLSAETNVLTQRMQAADLSARALDNQVQLTHALGGGYTDQTNAASVSQ
jgi:NodT family efflux transporter outer membrane factor (OMF) lipoprotein